MTTENKPAIQRVLNLITVAELARACQVSEQAVYKWLKKGYPPAERCTDIESAVRGKVSRFDLLPPQFHSVATPRRRKTDTPP